MESFDFLSGLYLFQKKHKSALKDVTLAEAVKHGSFSEFAFFNKASILLILMILPRCCNDYFYIFVCISSIFLYI